jgi:hypothetical protein
MLPAPLLTLHRSVSEVTPHAGRCLAAPGPYLAAAICLVIICFINSAGYRSAMRLPRRGNLPDAVRGHVDDDHGALCGKLRRRLLGVALFRSPPSRASSRLRKSPPGFRLKTCSCLGGKHHVTWRKHRPLFRRPPRAPSRPRRQRRRGGVDGRRSPRAPRCLCPSGPQWRGTASAHDSDAARQ